MAGGADRVLIAMVAAAMPVALVLALRQLDVLTRVFDDAALAAADLDRHPADLVVVEDGPGLDGLALVRALSARDGGRVPILLVAAGETCALRRAGLAAGATDVMAAPLDPLDFETRMRLLIEVAQGRRAVERHARAIEGTLARMQADASMREREIIRRLMLAAEFRDDQAGDHLTRVAGCAIAIAEGLGLSEGEADDIALASTMHDIGKISIPDSILLKPGPLSPAERSEMQQHALRGYHMLTDSPSRLLQLASDIALTHHERWDGTGYPQGLAGEAIPLAGRIIAVADVFDALTSARVYKPAWPIEAARAHVEAHAGSHFDPGCVAAFVSRWDDVALLMREKAP